MIARIWHGWTSAENADAYESLLQHEIFINIRKREIPGFRGIQLLRSQTENETAFVTIMRFDNLGSVKAFAGEHYQTAVVPEEAQKLLIRYDAVSSHYEIREEISR
jgi:antibiotic biosynthesis monooxygenase (ABM) superfamily enzyme